MNDQSEKDYQIWRNQHRQILREMYEDLDSTGASFEEYCRLTFQSLKQTETLHANFGLDVNID